MTGFSVGSNVADYIHSEEMEEFGGTVALHDDSEGALQAEGSEVMRKRGPLRVSNDTPHPLDDCRVLRGGKSGGIELAQVGRLDPRRRARS